MELEYLVDTDNLSINSILKNKLNISSNLYYKLIKGHFIYLNNEKCDTRTLANKNDLITIDFGYAEDNSNIVPKDIPFKIIYEDEWILVVQKDAGIATIPSILHYEDTLENGIKFYFDKINLKKKVRPVNRLDLNTSGLVVFAKCEYIQQCLINQMKNNLFSKEYLAICEGTFNQKIGEIRFPIGRKPGSIIEREVSSNGKLAITDYEVIKEFNNLSLVKCILKTGRTHQIRIHMKEISHPLLGDSLYGNKSDLISRQSLHCYKITFIHPITKNKLELISNLPQDFLNIIYRVNL